jgi:hypothetical protein
VLLLFNPLHSEFRDLITHPFTLFSFQSYYRWPPLPTPIRPTTSLQTHTISTLRANRITTRCIPGSVLTSGPLSFAGAYLSCVVHQAAPADGQYHPEGHREDIVQPIRGDGPGRMQDPHIDLAYQGPIDHHPQLMAVSNIHNSAIGPSFDQ